MQAPFDTPLKKHRESLSLTQRSMAIRLGIDPKHYRRMEFGLARPSLVSAKDLENLLGKAVTRDQLLFPEDYATKLVKRKRAA